jgi:hypothetical protein
MADPTQYEIQVESGSFFGTEEYRRQKGWSDFKHQEERVIKLTDATNQSAVQINTSFNWTVDLINGSQAGIYYFLDGMNWIKFVKEKLTKGVFLVLAYQIDGVPMVSGKISVPDDNNCVCLGLSLLPNNVVAGYYRFASEDDWLEMPRGIGWKVESELGYNEPRDSHLDAEDPVGLNKAVVKFPVKGASFKLITEQWKPGSTEIVTFKPIHLSAQ